MESPSAYLTHHFRAAWAVITETKAALIVGAIQNEMISHFGLFWATSPLHWLLVLWSLDFLLGSIRALKAGQWSARRALLSGVKLATWASIIGVGHVFRHSNLIGGSLIASALDAVVLLSEGSSVVTHGGHILGSPKLLRIGTALMRGSDRAALSAAALIDPESEKDKDNANETARNAGRPSDLPE